MKIIQIIPALGLGGPTFSVTALTRHIMKSGHEIQLYAQDKGTSVFADLNIHPFRILKFPYNKQLAFSISLRKEIKEESHDADIIQTNSLWQYPNFVMNTIPKSSSAKIVIVPRGTLSEYALSLSSLKKKIVLALGQRKALKRAHLFIATCEKEYHDIRRFGLKQPVAVIPNGIELPVLDKVDKKRNVLFLARIHKVKGLDVLLDAWDDIARDSRFSDWNLIVAGPTDSDYAKQMMARASGIERVTFSGELYGEDKRRIMSESSVYVLPTHTENFGISIAEALAHETPVITTTGAPWKGLEEHDCGRWVELSHENIKKSLMELMGKPLSELSLMGRNGRKWIASDFSWSEIAKKTIMTYKWLLDPLANQMPDWIHLD